jgi:nicotinate-nucleotide adenylyltransferase
MARRIGIYPGSFDPVHPGHIALSIETMRACALDEVVFLPERLPRNKPDVTDITQRITLLEQATAATTKLRVVRLGSERFTVQDTLPELRQEFEGADLTLLVGSDVAHTFIYRWDGLDVLLGEVSLAIGLRDTDTREDMSMIMRRLEEELALPIAYTLIDTEHSHMSSSQLRGGKAADWEARA